MCCALTAPHFFVRISSNINISLLSLTHIALARHITHPNSSSTRPANCASKTTKCYILRKRYTALATEAAGTISSLWLLQEATTTPGSFHSNKQCEFQMMNNSSGRWYRSYIHKDFLLGVKRPTNEFIILKLILKNSFFSKL